MPPGTDLLGISSLNSSLSLTIYQTEADDRYDDRFDTTTLGAVFQMVWEHLASYKYLCRSGISVKVSLATQKHFLKM